MSSSTPSKLPASAPTVLELGNRRSLEVSRTIPANLALGTTPPGTPAGIDSRNAMAIDSRNAMAIDSRNAMAIDSRNAMAIDSRNAMVVDAHLIAIGTPTPGSVTPSAFDAMPAPTSLTAEPIAPKTVFQGARVFVPPSRPVTNAPRASIALALLLGLFSLAIAPLAPLAWLCAAEQLDLVQRGLRRPTGVRWLHAVQGIGIAMTMVAVAATAFGITVVIARLMH
jgi:hypothetical protein